MNIHIVRHICASGERAVHVFDGNVPWEQAGQPPPRRRGRESSSSATVTDSPMFSDAPAAQAPP